MSFFKTADKTQIYYSDLGRGAPDRTTVVLIHGWPLSSAMWEHQVLELLDQGFRVVAYDRRGFGKSDPAAAGYDYDTMASDLNDLLTHLNLEAVTLVGFSMGGGEIARYLAKYGTARVAKTVLISSVVPYMLQTDTNPEGVPAEQFDQMIEGLKKDRPKFLAAFNKQFFGVSTLKHPVSEETLDWTASIAYQASLKATIECVNAFGRTDFRADMKAFTVPTLIIHGSGDKTVPIEATGRAAAKAIPAASFKIYDGAPHGLFITHMDNLNRDLLEFLRS